jgi:hypothetical protein
MRMPKLGACIVIAVLGLAAGSAATVPAAAAAGTGTVTIVHGIPNTPVDVYANGKKILSGFTFKTVTSPLSLPAGRYAIAVRKAGAAAGSAPILAATEQVPAGANLTIVADLTAAGKAGLRSEHAYIAGFASIGLSFLAWATSLTAEKAGTDRADRWGIFVGHWAPTFFGLGNALRTYEKT